jgi:hypothetical protein
MANKCQPSKNKSEPNVAAKLAVVDKSFDVINALKDYEVKEATIKDSLLTVKFKFKGCEEDDFDLVFDGNFFKSFPPKATLFLVRKSVNKNCDKSMEKELTFILTPTKYPGGKTLIVSLPKFETKLLYNY